MHQFHPRWSTYPDGPPPIGDLTFADTRDVVAYCELDRCSTWRTWPEIWHLDDAGAFQCDARGSSFDSLRRYARAPRQLFRCREIDLGYPCPNRWMVIEPRHEWRDVYAVTEADAAAFVKLGKALGRLGVTLLDVLILNQEPRWWSMRELTTGTTAWT